MFNNIKCKNLKLTCIEYKDDNEALQNFIRLRKNKKVNIEMKLVGNNILLHSDNIDKLIFKNIPNNRITNLYSIFK